MKTLEAAAKRAGLALSYAGTGKNKKLVLPATRKDFKEVLRLLDDDYLESILIEGATFQVNSKRRVSPNG